MTLTEPSYLWTALANDTYGKNITDLSSYVAAQLGAILAINGTIVVCEAAMSSETGFYTEMPLPGEIGRI